MYQEGKGVPQDYAEAVKWYHLAAEQGYAPAQDSLGDMYFEGFGVPQDDAEALKWYRLAAEQGMPQAQYQLGRMYGNGHGVSPDFETAYMWAYIASERGEEAFAPAAEVITLLSKVMTNAEIAQGTLWAKECMDSGYTKCGY